MIVEEVDVCPSRTERSACLRISPPRKRHVAVRDCPKSPSRVACRNEPPLPETSSSKVCSGTFCQRVHVWPTNRPSAGYPFAQKSRSSARVSKSVDFPDPLGPRINCWAPSTQLELHQAPKVVHINASQHYSSYCTGDHGRLEIRCGRVAHLFGSRLPIPLICGCPTPVARFWRRGGHNLHSG